MSNTLESTARLATIAKLRKTTLPLHLDPVPGADTLREWFKDIPHFKANPTAKRGGGQIYYSVSAVEKFIKSRTIASAQ